MNAWRDAPTLIGRYVTLRPLTLDDRDRLIETVRDAIEDLLDETPGARPA